MFPRKRKCLSDGSTAHENRDYSEATGVEFAECFSNRMEIVLDELSVPFIGYEDFVLNKRSSGRLKDLADLESLGEDLE